MTLVSSLNYVIWESYKPKTVSAPFLSIFVSSVLWFWPWHFSNFTQKWNSMVQVDRSRWIFVSSVLWFWPWHFSNFDLYNDASFWQLVSSLNYVIWESYKPKTVSAPFLSIFVSSVLWFWPWHFSNFAQKWNSMVQVDNLDEIFTMTLVSA